MQEISVTEYKALRDSKQEHLLLDVREDHELAICQIDGNTHIPMNAIPERLNEIADWKQKKVICQCRSGARSANVQAYLIQQGFEDVSNLVGGILAWGKEIDPSITQY